MALNLITDRTQADVADLKALLDKAKAGTITAEEWKRLLSPDHHGAYNYTDLNRVNAAMDYLAAKIRSHGNIFELKEMEIPHKKVSRLPEADVEETRDPYLWYEDDIPTVDLMQNYLDNVRTLRGAMPMPANTPSVPADMEDLTVDEANHIEVILSIVEALLINMSAAWFYSGEIFSGEV